MPGVRKLIDATPTTERELFEVLGEGRVAQFERVTLVEVAEIEALSYSEAIAYTATSGFDITGRRRAGGANWWTVTEERKTPGTWVEIT
jgi:hypothetical protein